MTRSSAVLAAGLTTLVVLACAPQPADTMAADLEAINQVRQAEVTTMAAGDVEGALAIRTDDHIMLPPNEPMITGPEALQEWTQGFIDLFSADVSYTEHDIIVSGDWAFERYAGTMTLTPKAGGDPIVEVIKGIHIYRRQADGSWKIAQDIWNSDNPAESM